MLRKTHGTVGITASLILTMPATVPVCALAIMGGALGGLLPDYDRSDGIRPRRIVESTIFFVVLVALFFTLDQFMRFGLTQFVLDELSLASIPGMVVLAGLIVYGTRTLHRSFTHSFLYIGAASVSAFFHLSKLAGTCLRRSYKPLDTRPF